MSTHISPLSSPDALIRSMLQSCKRIAMVGASDTPTRPSFIVFRYLHARGYDVIPVVSSLADITEPIDIIDIFRSSDAVPAIVDEALALPVLPKVIWMQLGVRHDDAARKAEAAGIAVIMDRCPKIEYARLLE